MGKGVRFDHSFLVQETEKRKKWKSKGKRAGHGGEFNIHAPLAELNRSVASVMNPPSAQPTKFMNTASTALVDKSELPSWLISILERDHDVQYLVTTKKAEHESPHKTRLAQGIKQPKLINDTKLAEHWLQVRLFYMLETQYREIYPLCFAIPNGGYRTPKAAATMRYEGQKSGVPDIFIPIPRGKYHGFFLEVKTDKGRPSKDQVEKINAYREQGYHVTVGKGFDECHRQITEYLQLPLFDNVSILPQNIVK